MQIRVLPRNNLRMHSNPLKKSKMMKKKVIVEEGENVEDHLHLPAELVVLVLKDANKKMKQIRNRLLMLLQLMQMQGSKWKKSRMKRKLIQQKLIDMPYERSIYEKQVGNAIKMSKFVLLVSVITSYK